MFSSLNIVHCGYSKIYNFSNKWWFSSLGLGCTFFFSFFSFFLIYFIWYNILMASFIYQVFFHFCCSIFFIIKSKTYSKWKWNNSAPVSQICGCSGGYPRLYPFPFLPGGSYPAPGRGRVPPGRGLPPPAPPPLQSNGEGRTSLWYLPTGELKLDTYKNDCIYPLIRKSK